MGRIDVRRGDHLRRGADGCQGIPELVGEHRDEFVLSAILVAQPAVQSRQVLLVPRLRRHVDRHAIEMGWRAVCRVISPAERADPFRLARRRMYGSIDDVVGGSVADRLLDGVASGEAIVLVDPRVEIVDGDPVVRREEEMLLDPRVPLEFIEGKVAVPESDARQACRVVQTRSVQRERLVGNGA